MYFPRPKSRARPAQTPGNRHTPGARTVNPLCHRVTPSVKGFSPAVVLRMPGFLGSSPGIVGRCPQMLGILRTTTTRDCGFSCICPCPPGRLPLIRNSLLLPPSSSFFFFPSSVPPPLSPVVMAPDRSSQPLENRFLPVSPIWRLAGSGNLSTPLLVTPSNAR